MKYPLAIFKKSAISIFRNNKNAGLVLVINSMTDVYNNIITLYIVSIFPSSRYYTIRNHINISDILNYDFSQLDENNIKYDPKEIFYILNKERAYDESFTCLSDFSRYEYTFTHELNRSINISNNNIIIDNRVIVFVAHFKGDIITTNIRRLSEMSEIEISISYSTIVAFHIFDEDEYGKAEECRQYIQNNFINKNLQELYEYHEICPFFEHDDKDRSSVLNEYNIEE